MLSEAYNRKLLTNRHFEVRTNFKCSIQGAIRGKQHTSRLCTPSNTEFFSMNVNIGLSFCSPEPAHHVVHIKPRSSYLDFLEFRFRVLAAAAASAFEISLTCDDRYFILCRTFFLMFFLPQRARHSHNAQCCMLMKDGRNG